MNLRLAETAVKRWIGLEVDGRESLNPCFFFGKLHNDLKNFGEYYFSMSESRFTSSPTVVVLVSKVQVQKLSYVTTKLSVILISKEYLLSYSSEVFDFLYFTCNFCSVAFILLSFKLYAFGLLFFNEVVPSKV